MKSIIAIADTQVCIEGRGERTIVMLHGWPDTRELWRQQITFLREEYVCVSFTLPGFDSDDRADYTVQAVVERIAQIVDAVSPDKQVTLLAHDWGCVFGYEYAMQHSDRVEAMLGLDVGDADSQAFRQSLSVAGKLMVFIYQSTLAISFICPRFLGNAITRFMARALQARSNMAHVHAGMNMPYAMRWLGVNGGLTNLLPVTPTFPFYYAYATQKPVMFHSPEWLQQLQQNPHNKVQSFDCGHWIMVDKAEAFNHSARQWLREHNPSNT